MGLETITGDGQTPLDDDEKTGLLIPTISTRSELNEFEQQNIEDAMQWVLGKSFSDYTILTDRFIRQLHRRMFGNVWNWAGDFRTTNKNIGVDKWQIPMELRNLCDDTRYWLENNIHPSDEIAIRFKHRLVSIHCFPNGNGRHSRLMADVIVQHVFNRPLFSWGTNSQKAQVDARSTYIQSLRLADKGLIVPLLEFARS